MGPDDLAAAGLYDPDAPHAAERLALVEYLLGLGASMDELVERRDELPVVAADLRLRVGAERLTLAEVTERSGVPAEVVLRTWRAAGFAEPGPEDRPFSEFDVEMMASFNAVLELLEPEAVLQLIRVMGSAMARVADAMVSAFVVNVGHPSMVEDPAGLRLARANADAAALIPAASRYLDMLLRRHAMLLRRPYVPAAPAAVGYDARPTTVVFADLVGSTALVRRLGLAELGAAIGDFEAMASDLVTARGGRLVKLIGDQAMFVVGDPAAACAVGLALAGAVADHPVLPEVRVGIAGGEVLSRDGDCFGPVVNLAARLVKAGPPGALVTTADVAAVLGDEFHLEPLGPQALAGFDDPVEAVLVRRAAVELPSGEAGPPQ
jgi:class 3 adenylate cyclase